MNHTTNPQDAIEVFARLLCAADAHVHGNAPWEQLYTTAGRSVQDGYRDAARWLLPRMTVAAEPSVVVSADRATLRDRIADTVTPFLANFSDEESARINAAEVATALLAVLPAPAPVCICGHSKQQHFEDACITEITGCNCGDYLEPQDAAEVIDRWRQAALHARAADRATLLREAADDEEGDELACVDECGSCDACGMEPFGTPAEGWREAARFLRRTARDSTDRQGALHGARLIEAELRRVAAEEQPAETQAEEPETEEQRVRAHVTTLHLIGEQLAGIESWMWELLADVRDAEERPVVGEQPDTQEARHCTCADGGDCFVPLGHYTDCPANTQEGDRA